MLTIILNSNNFKNLNEFSIINDRYNCISDLSLIAISKYCLNLKTLHIQCCQITDDGLIAIAKKCLKLENINFHIMKIFLI